MTDLHIIQSEKIANATVNTYRENFSTENNPFIVLDTGKFNAFDNRENVSVIPDSFSSYFKLLSAMKKADRIHIRGLFSLCEILVLALNKRLAKKSVWYIWGGDLYSLLTPKKSIKNRLLLTLRKMAIKNIPAVSTNIAGDHKTLCDFTKKDYKLFKLEYNPTHVENISSFVNVETAHKGVNILLGNSATETNMHLEALDILSKFKDEDISIYVPLSYGTTEYRNKVIEKGRTLFGDKFIPLVDFMPKDEYFKLLMSVDVAIFAHNRQQAMGNIVPLLWAGKKVYIRHDISTWGSLHDEKSIAISDYYDIENMSFDDFSKKNFDENKQRQFVESMTDKDRFTDSIRRILISENQSDCSKS